MKAPRFWYQTPPEWLNWLVPLSWPYDFIGRLRQHVTQPYRASIPVICVGNLTVGGTGKTPVVLELVKLIRHIGHSPHILTRGYGGYLKNAMVMPEHTAINVGDEALLLRRAAPVWVGGDRAHTATLAERAGACCLIMDDGLQNPGLHKDFNIVVIDGAVGFGNKMALPLGPLRESWKNGLRKAQVVILMGEDKTNLLPSLPANLPVIRADLSLNQADIDCLKDKKIIAFAGLGRPQKFKDSLLQGNLQLAAFYDYPDHHTYTPQDLSFLHSAAEKENAILVTTEKDFVRLTSEQRQKITFIRAELKWQNQEKLEFMLYPLLDHK